MNRNGILRGLLPWVLAASVLVLPAPAQAAKEQPLLSRGTRTVLRTGLYGSLAGTAVGLVAFPFTQKVRTVFIGTSTGLYLGLALGLFLAWEDSEPEDYSLSRLGPTWRGEGMPALSEASPPLLYGQVTLLRF